MHLNNQIRTFSFGGGVQSTAALVLAVQGKIDFPTFLFCNVGDDSENPKTLIYVEMVAKPYAAAHGIELITLRRDTRRGPETLLEHLLHHERSLAIPVRMPNGAPGRRSCTADFKIDVVAKWQKQHGATRANPAVAGLGISTDEIHRARTDSGIPHQVLEYPLIDLELDRDACIALIADAGLPVPPKSACWFCPFHRHAEWLRMQEEEPELITRAIWLENLLNRRRKQLGRSPVYLDRKAVPLAQALGIADVAGDESAEFCESGYCMI